MTTDVMIGGKRHDGSGAAYIVGSGSVPDSTGNYSLNPESLAQILTYNGPGGAVDTITAGPDAAGLSYKQTFTYTGSNVTAISAWVKQ